MKLVAAIGAVLLAVIHQDYWNWHRVEPLIFGFIPVGLAWHVMISLLASVLAAFLVRFCWPSFVDVEEATAPSFHSPEH